MTAFDDAMGVLFADANLGKDVWLLDQSTSGHAATRAVITKPDLGELEGRAPMTKAHRWIDLLVGDGAVAGDLVAFGGVTYRLAGNPGSGVADEQADPDALLDRWIGIVFTTSPAFSYHADGYPLVTYTAGAWVAA